MNNPYCLILSGPSGSGKSTTAKKLWESIEGNPAYINMDSIKHLVYDAKSIDYFLDLARNSALVLTENYLNSNHTVILDKAFGSYDYVSPFIELSNRLNLRSHYFKLIAPLNVLIERVEGRRNFSLEEKIESGEWPLPAGNETTVRRIYGFFEEHQHSEGIEIDTEINSQEKVVEIILTHLNEFS